MLPTHKIYACNHSKETTFEKLWQSRLVLFETKLYFSTFLAQSPKALPMRP